MSNKIQMLETLKSEYLGMGFNVELTKYHVSGIAEGLDTHETMNFVDWEDACDWGKRATENPACPFVVVEMNNPVTGETVEF